MSYVILLITIVSFCPKLLWAGKVQVLNAASKLNYSNRELEFKIEDYDYDYIVKFSGTSQVLPKNKQKNIGNKNTFGCYRIYKVNKSNPKKELLFATGHDSDDKVNFDLQLNFFNNEENLKHVSLSLERDGNNHSYKIFDKMIEDAFVHIGYLEFLVEEKSTVQKWQLLDVNKSDYIIAEVSYDSQSGWMVNRKFSPDGTLMRSDGFIMTVVSKLITDYLRGIISIDKKGNFFGIASKTLLTVAAVGAAGFTASKMMGKTKVTESLGAASGENNNGLAGPSNQDALASHESSSLSIEDLSEINNNTLSHKKDINNQNVLGFLNNNVTQTHQQLVAKKRISRPAIEGLDEISTYLFKEDYLLREYVLGLLVNYFCKSLSQGEKASRPRLSDKLLNKVAAEGKNHFLDVSIQTMKEFVGNYPNAYSILENGINALYEHIKDFDLKNISETDRKIEILEKEMIKNMSAMHKFYIEKIHHVSELNARSAFSSDYDQLVYGRLKLWPVPKDKLTKDELHQYSLEFKKAFRDILKLIAIADLMTVSKKKLKNYGLWRSGELEVSNEELYNYDPWGKSRGNSGQMLEHADPLFELTKLEIDIRAMRMASKGFVSDKMLDFLNIYPISFEQILKEPGKLWGLRRQTLIIDKKIKHFRHISPYIWKGIQNSHPECDNTHDSGNWKLRDYFLVQASEAVLREIKAYRKLRPDLFGEKFLDESIETVKLTGHPSLRMIEGILIYKLERAAKFLISFHKYEDNLMNGFFKHTGHLMGNVGHLLIGGGRKKPLPKIDPNLWFLTLDEYPASLIDQPKLMNHADGKRAERIYEARQEDDLNQAGPSHRNIRSVEIEEIEEIVVEQE